MVAVWASGTNSVAVLSNEAGETAGSPKLGGVHESGKKLILMERWPPMGQIGVSCLCYRVPLFLSHQSAQFFGFSTLDRKRERERIAVLGVIKAAR